MLYRSFDKFPPYAAIRRRRSVPFGTLIGELMVLHLTPFISYGAVLSPRFFCFGALPNCAPSSAFRSSGSILRPIWYVSAKPADALHFFQPTGLCPVLQVFIKPPKCYRLMEERKNLRINAFFLQSKRTGCPITFKQQIGQPYFILANVGTAERV